MPVRIGQDYNRLIIPTRKNAPTEYNLQYKKWLHHSGIISKPVPTYLRKGRLAAPGRIWSTRQPQSGDKGVVDLKRSTRYKTASNSGATCGSDSYMNFLNGDIPGLNATLQTAAVPLHTKIALSSNERPKEKPNKASSYVRECEKRAADKRLEAARVRSRPLPREPPRQAWTENKEECQQRSLEKDISAKLHMLSVYSEAEARNNRVKPTPLTKELGADCQLLLSDLLSATTDVPRRPGLDISENATSPHPTSAATPRLKSNVKKTSPDKYKLKSTNLGCGIGEKDLRKIYTGASEAELKRLKQHFNGMLSSTCSRERVLKKQNTSEKDEAPVELTKGETTKDELDKIRAAAYRSSQKVANRLHQDAWTTSYNSDFCGNWLKDPPTSVVSDAEDGDSSDVSDEEEGAETSAGQKTEDHTANTKENAKSKGLDPKSEEEGTAKKTTSGTPELVLPKRSPSKADRIVKEAKEIVEGDYHGLFRADGKPKMRCETTFGSTYKDHKSKKPEEPVWAQKTMVSLGSGHWNNLWDHYDGWETSDPTYANFLDAQVLKQKSRKTPGNKYEVKVYDQGEPGTKTLNDEQRANVHVNFMTEYMRKYARIRLPRRPVLV